MSNSPASASWKKMKMKKNIKYRSQYTYLIIQNLMFENNPHNKKRLKKVKNPCAFFWRSHVKTQQEEMEGERKIAYV